MCLWGKNVEAKLSLLFYHYNHTFVQFIYFDAALSSSTMIEFRSKVVLKYMYFVNILVAAIKDK